MRRPREALQGSGGRFSGLVWQRSIASKTPEPFRAQAFAKMVEQTGFEPATSDLQSPLSYVYLLVLTAAQPQLQLPQRVRTGRNGSLICIDRCQVATGRLGDSR